MGGGERPRWVRICPVCRLPVRIRTQTGARHRQGDHLGLFNERENPHGSATVGAVQRVRLVHLLDAARPRARRGRGGDLVEFPDGRSLLSLGLPALPPARVTDKHSLSYLSTSPIPVFFMITVFNRLLENPLSPRLLKKVQMPGGAGGHPPQVGKRHTPGTPQRASERARYPSGGWATHPKGWVPRRWAFFSSLLRWCRPSTIPLETGHAGPAVSI